MNGGDPFNFLWETSGLRCISGSITTLSLVELSNPLLACGFFVESNPDILDLDEFSIVLVALEVSSLDLGVSSLDLEVSSLDLEVSLDSNISDLDDFSLVLDDLETSSLDLEVCSLEPEIFDWDDFSVVLFDLEMSSLEADISVMGDFSNVLVDLEVSSVHLVISDLNDISLASINVSPDIFLWDVFSDFFSLDDTFVFTLAFCRDSTVFSTSLVDFVLVDLADKFSP